MIKWIKLGNYIYQNIEPGTIDENGNEVWNIPADPVQLKQCIINTLGWLVARKLRQGVGSDKEKASTTKGIVLLAKIVKQIVDATNTQLNLTENEQNALEKMLQLAEIGYCDGQLLIVSGDLLASALRWYHTKMQELEPLDTTEELVQFLENLKEP